MEHTQHIKTSPKDFFLYLLSSIGLYYCAGWLISLLYDYINYEFGSFDMYGGDSWLPGSMRWAIASLIIVFPVYIWITRTINKDIDAHPEKRELRVRRWMMYLTLSLSSIALIIDLVALIYQFLSGEFALTFFLKAAAVALVAGLVFAYYFYELRREAGRPAPARSVFRYGAIALVAVSILGGFLIVGSPSEARSRRYDSDRVSDLQNIQWQIVNYWQQKGELPNDLTALNDSISGYRAPVDPETKAAYEYIIAGENSRSFELCATFNNRVRGSSQTPMINSPDHYQESWRHDAGRYCFSRSIDPDLYPVSPKKAFY